MNKLSKTKVEAAVYLIAGLILKPKAPEVVAAEVLLAGPILKPNVDEVKAAEELMRMGVPPTAATVAAILYLPTIKIAKPSVEFLNAAAYLVDPLDPVIKKPTPEEIQAAEVLLDQVKMTTPTAPEVKAMSYFIQEGILPAPTVWEVRAGAYLMDGPLPIIAKPQVEDIKATAYLQRFFSMDPLSKPTAKQVQATVYLQTTSASKMGGFIAPRPTPDQVGATLILWESQFGEKPYRGAYLSHVNAVAKGTTERQKSLIAWYIQKNSGAIVGGVAETLKPDLSYQYFKFVPVGFDVMASKAAPCLFSAGNYGSLGTDGFRVSNTYPTGLKEGALFVFEELVCDKAKKDAVTITKIEKP